MEKDKDNAMLQTFNNFISARSEQYEKALELWLEYNYRCATYDRLVCSGFDEHTGDYKPMSAIEHKEIIENANSMLRQIFDKAKGFGIPISIMNDVKKEFARYPDRRIIELYESRYRSDG